MLEWVLVIAIGNGNGGIDQKLITGFSSFELCTNAAEKIGASATETLIEAGRNDDTPYTFHCMSLKKA